MAEKNAATQTPAASPGTSSGGKPTLFILLAVVNMVVVMVVGIMLYLGQKKKDAEAGVDDVARGELETHKKEEESKEFIGKLVPLETFLVNVAGSRGRKLLKINMEFEVSNADVSEEIEKTKPRIRDYIIIIASSKSFAEISTKQGKDELREEIKNQINLILQKGQIKNVFFTEWIMN